MNILFSNKINFKISVFNCRFTLKEEKEKRRNSDLLYDKIREQLRNKEEQYIKEVEVNQQLETTLRTLEMELKIVRKNLNQVNLSLVKFLISYSISSIFIISLWFHLYYLSLKQFKNVFSLKI